MVTLRGSIIKDIFMLCAFAGTLLLSTYSFAVTGDIVARVRVVSIGTHNSASPVAGAALGSKTIPEVDLSYFFTDNISTELMLAYPQKHVVSLNGASLGALEQLPPTLLAQYHFTLGSFLSSYVGAELNYTRYSSVNMPGFSTSKSSTGGALQACFDVPVNKNLSINVDLEEVYMDIDVRAAAGAGVATLKFYPVQFGVGWAGNSKSGFTHGSGS